MNISHFLDIHAEKHPDKIAIQDMYRQCTYKTLAHRINSLANNFKKLGMNKQANIGILISNRIEHIEVILATAKLGATVIPLDYHWKEEELVGIISNFKIEHIIFEEEKLSLITNIQKEHQFFTNLININAVLDDENIKAYELLTQDTVYLKEEFVDQNDAFIVGITSGSTGFPKGTVITYGNLTFRFLAQIVEFGFTYHDKMLTPSPLFHGGGRAFSLNMLFVGGTLVLQNKFNPEAVLDAIEEYQITTTFMVPTMFKRVLEAQQNKQRNLESMRVMISSGSRLLPTLRKQVLQELSPNLYEYYAATEVGGIAICKNENSESKDQLAGRVFWNMNVKILDEQRNEVSIGEIGEIVCKSESISISYYQNQESTNASYISGWFATGDLGYLTEDNKLYIVGRKKNIIISGGKNIYPEEIEEVLSKHPLIQEVAVVGVSDIEWGEAVKAYIAPKTPNLSEEEILLYCGEKLAAYKKPKQIEFMDSLPKNSLGKIDLKTLKALANQVQEVK